MRCDPDMLTNLEMVAEQAAASYWASGDLKRAERWTRIIWTLHLLQAGTHPAPPDDAGGGT